MTAWPGYNLKPLAACWFIPLSSPYYLACTSLKAFGQNCMIHDILFIREILSREAS